MKDNPLVTNLIPSEKLERSDYLKTSFRIKKALKKYLIASLLGTAFFVGVVGVKLLSHTYDIPFALQTEYQEAQLKSNQLKTRLKIIDKADQDNHGTVVTIDTLASLKPSEIKLTRLDIDSINSSVQLEGFSTDPAIFSIYVDQIRGQKNLFVSAQLDRINSVGQGNIKTFSIKAEGVK